MSETLDHFVQAFEQQTSGHDGLQSLFELIIEQSSEGIIVADGQGVLRAFNAEAERQHGKGLYLVPASEWVRTYGLMNLDGTTIRWEDLAMVRALRGERVAYFAYRLHPAGEAERIIVGNANPLRRRDGQIAGAVVISRDETEHHHAAEQLRRSQSELQRSETLNSQMIVNSADCLLSIAPDGTVACLNLQVGALLGLGTRAVPRAWREFWPGPRSRKAAAAAFERALTGRVARFEGRTEFTAGEMRWWSAMLCPIRSAAGNTDSVFVALRDVTAMKEVEEKSRQRAIFAQQLMGIVSHDLRNPIGAILLSAGQLKRRHDLDAKVQRALDRMIWSAERANRLIYDLLDFTQAQIKGGLRITRQLCDAHEIVQRVVDELRVAHPDRAIVLTVRGEVTAEIDPDRVSQVVTNLVSNALQYGSNDVPVSVEVGGGDRYIRLKVHNDGPAIDPELLPNLFSPMQRGAKGSNRARSIGLGLYIVKMVARAHGGDAKVCSDDRGTEFSVLLPRQAADVDTTSDPALQPM